MDSCFTGWRDWAGQTTQKIRPVFPPVGPVTECAFIRWRIVLASYLDGLMSSHPFCVAVLLRPLKICSLQRQRGW